MTKRILSRVFVRQMTCSWWVLSVVLVASPASLLHADTTRQPASADYASGITQALQALDAGKFDEARKQLAGTTEAMRGFEFRYLMERLERSESGGAAGDLIRRIPKPDVDCRYGVLHPREAEVALICRDGSIRVYSLDALDKPVRTVEHPERSAIWSGVFSGDGKLFLSGHQNGDVLVWERAEWKLRQTINVGKSRPVRELVVAPDGTAFAAEAEKEVELWSLAGESSARVAGLSPRFNFGEGLSFSPQGDLIATGGMFDITLHDAKTGEKKSTFRHASYTMGIEFSPDGKRIASAPRGNVNKFLAVFEIGKTEPLFNAGPLGSYVAGMTFSPGGDRVIATGCDKAMRLYDAASGQVVLTLPRTECGVKPMFSTDGAILGWSEPSGFQFIDLREAP